MNRQELLHVLFSDRADKKITYRELPFMTMNGIVVKPVGFTISVYKG